MSFHLTTDQSADQKRSQSLVAAHDPVEDPALKYSSKRDDEATQRGESNLRRADLMH